MSTESDAKKAMILDMLDGWEASNRLSKANLNAYYRAAETVSVQAVRQACEMFSMGRVNAHDAAFMPSVPQFITKATEIDGVIASYAADRKIDEIFNVVVYKIGDKPPPGMQSLGEFEEARRAHADKMRDKITIPQLRRIVEKK